MEFPPGLSPGVSKREIWVYVAGQLLKTTSFLCALVFMFCVTEVTPCVSRIREPHCGRQMKSDIVRLQFSSGISHTKLGQSPHVKGTVYSKSLQTSVTSSGVPRPPPLLATNPEDAHNPLRFDSSLEQLTEFRKIPYVGLHFIVKDTDHHQPAEETGRVRSGRVLCGEFLCRLPGESGCIITLLAHQRVHYIGMIDLVIAHEIKLTLHAPSCPETPGEPPS